MREICRLSLPYEENGDMKKVLDAGLAKVGITWQDIFTQGERPTHFGNWVLVPVANNGATKKLADHFGTALDMFGSVIEKSDIDSLGIGDKVKVKVWGMFGLHEDEGRVLRIENEGTTAVILKKRSQSKGYRINVNDEAGIWKI